MRLITAIFLLIHSGSALAQSAPVPPTSDIPAQPDPCTGQPRVLYPPAAVREGREGDTVLAFTIGIDGRPMNISVAQSSGSPDLDEAAIEGAKCWRYKPAMKNGQPVEVEWNARVNWRLTKPESWLDRVLQ